MNIPLDQHQKEVERNLAAWRAKPLLQEIYQSFYVRILKLIDASIQGHVVEVGSGIGNLKSHLPAGAICTDLFPNPWLDLVCDGYDLPFVQGSLSHLVLFDVWHHLQRPNAFLEEARRVLADRGRLILFEPYMSLTSLPAYGLWHHEPVALCREIELSVKPPPQRHYYAAQGNATRLFFRRQFRDWPRGWNVFHAEAFSSFSYLLSGGYNKRALYPASWLKAGQWLDDRLSRWPRLFGARCLIGLQPLASPAGRAPAPEPAGKAFGATGAS